MLAMPALWRVRVLAVVYLVCTAHRLRVVPPQLLVLIVAGNLPLSHGLAFFFELLVGQRAETAECASNGVKDSHAQMLSRRGLAGKGGRGVAVSQPHARTSNGRPVVTRMRCRASVQPVVRGENTYTAQD